MLDMITVNNKFNTNLVDLDKNANDLKANVADLYLADTNILNDVNHLRYDMSNLTPEISNNIYNLVDDLENSEFGDLTGYQDNDAKVISKDSYQLEKSIVIALNDTDRKSLMKVVNA